jgi:hypothetical protein
MLTGLIILVVVGATHIWPRCAHEWRVVSRTVAAPRIMQGRKWQVELPQALRIFESSTTLVLTCGKCGALDERTVAGEPEEPEA